MALACGRYNARSDWLIVGHYSPVMPTGRLRACKNKANSHIINNLLISNVRSLWEYLKSQGFGIRFSRKDNHSRLISNKYHMATHKINSHSI